MFCYAVIDTNVLVSALLSRYSDSATVQVMDRLLEGEIVPIFSEEILQEYNDVLKRKQFHFSPDIVDALLDYLRIHGQVIVPDSTGAVLPDRKDIPFYEVVMDKQDEGAYLVTGNLKHYPRENFIVTPREMIEILDRAEQNGMV